MKYAKFQKKPEFTFGFFLSNPSAAVPDYTSRETSRLDCLQIYSTWCHRTPVLLTTCRYKKVDSLKWSILTMKMKDHCVIIVNCTQFVEQD